MELKVGPSAHLTYCSNIHAGETWPEVEANLQQYVPALKKELAPDRPFGIGLRLSDRAARSLHADSNLLGKFKAWLQEQGLYVFTLNGFPYGGFHGQVVKDRVYAPDWSQPERGDYTRRTIAILAALLPADIDGGISTVPLSYKPWFFTAPSTQQVLLQRSCEHLARLAEELAVLRRETGKCLHLDLEPEPDCWLETTAETIAFFKDWLLPQGIAYLRDRWGDRQAEEILREHLRVCYDTCHFAVGYEEPPVAFERFQAAGIQIGKIQLSAALRISLAAGCERQQLHDRLQAFAESTYLHQVVARYADGHLERYRDLPSALPFLLTTEATEWRTHFHVPIFIEDYRGLQSTQADLALALQQFQQYSTCKHLEIETYTWEVLPPEMKQDLLTSIQREYTWVLGQLD